MEIFTQKDVMELLHLPRWQVQYYSDKRIVEPEFGLGGRGNARRYGKKNLIQYSLIKCLADYGLQSDDIEFAVRYLFEKMPIVKSGKTKRGCRFDDIVSSVKDSWYLLFHKTEKDISIEIWVDKPLSFENGIGESVLIVDFLKLVKRIM